MPAEHILHSIIASIDRLTPFPRIARRAFEIATDKDVSIDDLIDVVQYDQVITSKCLQLCNSSYFWIKEEVVSLRRAVVILGTLNIVKIILAHCIKIPEYTGAHDGYGLGEGELWRHSVSCAVLSGLLAGAAGLHGDATLFTAALLHDVGKLVLSPFAEEKASEIEAMLKSGHSVIETEKALFEIDHAELGGMIAAGWNFPAILINSIREHHTSLEGNDKPGGDSWVRLTNLVAYVCEFHATCHHIGEVECSIKPSILSRFGLKPEDIDRAIQVHQEEMQKLDTLL